jgi:hypothetical protein
LSAPSASQQKVVDYLSIYNSDTADAVVTVYINSSSVTYKLLETTLSTGEKLEFQEGQGFRCLLSDGSLKIADNQGFQSVSNAVNYTVMTSNVTNTTATYANVTGLQFAMTAGETYWFKYCIPTSTNNASRGFRYSINSAATASYLAYMRMWTTSANANAYYSSRDYDSSEAAPTASSAPGGIATMEGIITAATSGNLIARFSISSTPLTLTARAGAVVFYQRLN